MLPAIVAVVQVVGTYFAGTRQPEARSYDVLAALLLLIGPAALTQRHRHPVPVLGITFLATVVYGLFDYPGGPIFFAHIVAFISVVMTGHRLVAAGFLLAGYAAFLWLGHSVGSEGGPDLPQALAVGAWMLVLFTGAEIARSRRERAIEAQRTQAEQSARRASEERLRIARELHDVLAHNISLMNVQAGVALHLIDEQPEQARDALAAIKQASNEALGELRSVLDILRYGNEAEPRSPTSGLSDLGSMISRAEAAGVNVTRSIGGTPVALPPKVDLAAYRIVQEALTNVTRHAGSANARIHLEYGDRDLALSIEDDGGGVTGRASAPPSGGGRGIRGMRERAVALGGELHAGPRPEGGFAVRARLPLGEDDGSEPAGEARGMGQRGPGR